MSRTQQAFFAFCKLCIYCEKLRSYLCLCHSLCIPARHSDRRSKLQRAATRMNALRSHDRELLPEAFSGPPEIPYTDPAYIFDFDDRATFDGKMLFCIFDDSNGAVQILSKSAKIPSPNPKFGQNRRYGASIRPNFVQIEEIGVKSRKTVDKSCRLCYTGITRDSHVPPHADGLHRSVIPKFRRVRRMIA